MSDPNEGEAYRRLGFETSDALEKMLNVRVPSGAPNSSKDRLTLLLPSPGYRAAKLYRKHEDGKVKVFEYYAGTWFRVVEIGVNSAWDLFRALSATSVSAVENFAVRAGLSASGRSRLAAGREIRQISGSPAALGRSGLTSFRGGCGSLAASNRDGEDGPKRPSRARNRRGRKA
jgi:hypothetical protein